MQKHWSIVMEDPQLHNSIPTKPKVSYRPSRNNKNRIAPSQYKSTSSKISSQLKFFNIRGMFRYWKPRYLTCKFVPHDKRKNLPDSCFLHMFLRICHILCVMSMQLTVCRPDHPHPQEKVRGTLKVRRGGNWQIQRTQTPFRVSQQIHKGSYSMGRGSHPSESAHGWKIQAFVRLRDLLDIHVRHFVARSH